jgi:hypothetical protein
MIEKREKAQKTKRRLGPIKRTKERERERERER